jgi:hypothetical protein
MCKIYTYFKQTGANKMLKFENEYAAIPGSTQDGLTRYVENRIFPGGFLTAVLSNDLMQAVAKADNNNIVALPLIAKFIYNRMPMQCHGSITKMEQWCDHEKRDELFRHAQGLVGR